MGKHKNRERAKPPDKPQTERLADGLICRMLVHDLKLDTTIREHEVDFSKQSSRRWVEKTIIWAITNGKSVEILHRRDDT